MPPPPLVLVVDDEESIRTFVAVVLRRSGYSVTETNSCVRALEILILHPELIDVLITDINMPRLGGTDLVALAPFKPRVIFMSADPYALVDRGLAATERLLAKPFSPAELTQAVADVLLAQDVETPGSNPA